MKVLLWMLVFYATQDLSCERSWKKVDKSWNTLYLVSNNKEKISENGTLRFYIRDITFNGNVGFRFSFFLRVNGTCQSFIINGRRPDEDYYFFEYLGKIYVRELYRSKNLLVIFLISIGDDGLVTSMLMALGKKDDLSPEEYEYFKAKTKEMVVPVKNIIKVAGTDVCPRDLPVKKGSVHK